MVDFNTYFNVCGQEYFNADLSSDSAMFLDPDAISKYGSDLFNAKAVAKNMSVYSKRVYSLYRSNRKREARNLLSFPQEVKYTRVGYGHESSKYGRGTSLDILDEVLSSLIESKVDLKLVEEYPQFLMLLTRNFGPDRLSDLITNLAYEQLVEFTQKVCQVYKIPLDSEVGVNFFSIKDCMWIRRKVKLPVDDNRMPILLIPKNAVVENYHFSSQKFLQKVLLLSRQNQLQSQGIRMSKRNIYLQEVLPYGDTKEYILRRVIDDPELMLDYLLVNKRLA